MDYASLHAAVLALGLLLSCGQEPKAPEARDREGPKPPAVRREAAKPKTHRPAAPKPETGEPKPSCPKEVEAVLVTLRSGEVPQEPHVKRLTTWLGGVVRKGKTRHAEIIRLFGKHYKDLDRPERDGIKTHEYYLGPRGNNASWYYLVFDLDSKTDIVTDWRISHAICGFCPHVFVDDGQWRLEGKLLADCVGKEREGADLLPLPRLRARDGCLRVKLANLAPELEYLDHVQLGEAALRDGEELDVSIDGQPVIWRPEREHRVDWRSTGMGAAATIELDPDRAGDVAVLEVRNTPAFEAAMRDVFLRGHASPHGTSLAVHLGEARPVLVAPVGTKFLRRVAVHLPRAARRLALRTQGGYWSARRLWTGTSRAAEHAVVWRLPSRVMDRGAAALRLLRARDGQRFCLRPAEQAVLEFVPSGPPSPGQRTGHVLRACGYYEFIEGSGAR